MLDRNPVPVVRAVRLLVVTSVADSTAEPVKVPPFNLLAQLVLKAQVIGESFGD